MIFLVLFLNGCHVGLDHVPLYLKYFLSYFYIEIRQRIFEGKIFLYVLLDHKSKCLLEKNIRGLIKPTLRKKLSSS